MDQIGDLEDLISDSAATLLHGKMCDKPHPSNLTASFKVMGEASLSVYQHSVLQISLYTLTTQERS